MIGYDTQRRRSPSAFFELFFAIEIYATKFGGALEERDEEIGVVVGDDALEDGGGALEAHAGVDGGLGEGS